MLKKRVSATKPGRKRRIAGVSLLALAVVGIAVLPLSAWKMVAVSSGHWMVWVGRGTASVDYIGYPPKDGFVVSINDPSSWRDGVSMWRVQTLRPARSYGILGDFDGWPHVHDYRLAAYMVDAGSTVYYRSVRVALWPFVIVPLAGGAALWRSGRRAAQRALTNHCAACGYHLAGLVSSASCPECGRAGAV